MSIFFIIGAIAFFILLIVTVPIWNLTYDLKYRLEKSKPKWGRK